MIAYFSMEICLDQHIPTYSGGLGVLAGDTLRSAADLQVPMVAVTLLHRKGYFAQSLDADGRQQESPEQWHPESMLEATNIVVPITLAGRKVMVRAWRYTVIGVTGHSVPVYLLDTALDENSDWDRALTDTLYGGDNYYRLCQEMVLGIGGAAVLEALGAQIGTSYHINEGHAALLTVVLLERVLHGRHDLLITDADLEEVRRHVIFTTHTPVPAGHDKFTMDMVRPVLGDARSDLLERAKLVRDGTLNMTTLALRLSRYVNGVAMRHREVSRGMFPDFPIEAVTNGVHATTWTAEPFKDLFDRFIPEWRRDNLYLRYALDIPLDAIRAAHAQSKSRLIDEVKRRTGVALDPAVMTIGFARRATPYKRADLIVSDLDRLRRIAKQAGKIQIVFGGKAHPRDEGGKELISRIHDAARRLADDVRVVFLANYDMALARILVPGVDLWLNNPMKPLEASGTSGMKAALNGVPSLSVLDGWWIEGHIEGVTGWSIGTAAPEPGETAEDAEDLYRKLEQVIVPLFYKDPQGFATIMRQAISLNGSFFNTQRMVMQYLRNAYALSEHTTVQSLTTDRTPVRDASLVEKAWRALA